MGVNERDFPKGPVGYNFSTRVRIGDYEGELEITGQSLNDVRKAVRLLPEAGIEPVRAATGWQLTPEGLPICPKHGAPMKERSKQGDVWHSHNVGTEDNPLWCRGYPGKESPGWER